MADRPSLRHRVDRESFRALGATHPRGMAAEQFGVEWLARAGYRIVSRNVRTPQGEIDVVAEDGDTLCFVEVKARAGDECGNSLDAVTVSKQVRLARAAASYLVARPWAGPLRFDVLGLDLADDGWRCTLLRDAFEMPPVDHRGPRRRRR
jgi:putative endonuclease